MRVLLDVFAAWPMPLVWAMAVALLLRRRGRALLAVAALLLVVSSLPIVGRALLAPLSAGAVVAEALAPDHGAATIVVPTAGSFRDAAGRWWPEEGSIRRFAAGNVIAERLGLPLVVVGGAPYGNQPAEAETVMRLFAPGDRTVQIVPRGRNSVESAAALATLSNPKLSSVILVTDGVHIARMRAVLRAQGIAVVASIAPAMLDPERADRPHGVVWRDFVPSDAGLDATGAAFREYIGIAWYLVTGNISVSDL